MNQLSTNGLKQVNGKSPERSDSPTSTSTATSVGTLTPPSLREYQIVYKLTSLITNINLVKFLY